MIFNQHLLHLLLVKGGKILRSAPLKFINHHVVLFVEAEADSGWFYWGYAAAR